MDIRYGGQLKPGDFIAVVKQKRLELGWFCKSTKINIHYYQFKWIDSYDDLENPKVGDIIKGYTQNNQEPYFPRVIKIDPNVLNEEDYANYVKGVELLKKLKLI